MKELGDYLRQAREKKNISLRDIQESTKIRLRYLEGIEQGDLEMIPGEVYRKGFLANYANAVGLDAEAVLRKYNELKNPGSERAATPQTISEKPVVKPVETVAKTQPKPVGLKGVYWGVGIALVGVAAFILLMPLFRSKPPVKIASSVPQKAASAPKQAPVQVTPTPTPGESPAPSVADPATTVDAPIRIEAEFTDKVWVGIDADGTQPLTKNGKTFTSADPKQTWTAQNTMVIKLGNPAGVRLTFNGQDVGPIGKYGIPITITFTPAGIKEAP
ncbi:cytoskeletal protein RodZ [Hydrogenispora ethanolica]|uniref:Cytoskeletal protein RodZ n=1 Tax=Hydrogenispora ethanolica TaxID=1082276 RepID=A0A4R1R867_HYDET|nr:RodZ domain-containing protein [Hydrogenispora ethanolica]TCL61542.1 cytoskeletal protein RodZ [Hydrogenispora ethanolica]